MLKVESPRGRALWLLLLGACGTGAVTDSRAPSPLAGVEAELRAITPAEEGRFVATIRSGARLSFDAAGARLGEGGPRIQLAAWGRGSLTPLLSAAPQLGQCTPDAEPAELAVVKAEEPLVPAHRLAGLAQHADDRKVPLSNGTMGADPNGGEVPGELGDLAEQRHVLAAAHHGAAAALAHRHHRGGVVESDGGRAGGAAGGEHGGDSLTPWRQGDPGREGPAVGPAPRGAPMRRHRNAPVTPCPSCDKPGYLVARTEVP